MTKICVKCEEDKELTEFRKDKILNYAGEM